MFTMSGKTFSIPIVISERVRMWCKQNESVDPSCLVSAGHAAAGGMVCDTVMPTWSRISKECFQYLVENIKPRF